MDGSLNRKDIPMRALAVAVLALTASSAASAQFPVYDGPRFQMERVADGVYAFVHDNPLGPAVDATAVVIVNADDVIVVDAQNTALASRRIIAELRKLTPKPVRYVITTHWHGDHWWGNQAYQEAYPGVEFVAHPNTVLDIQRLALPTFDSLRLKTLPDILKSSEEQYARAIRRDGQPYTAFDSTFMRNQVALLRWLVPTVREQRVVMPTITVADSMVFQRGERSIVVRWLGRGNTRGDLTVWLPRERVLAMGDLLVHPGPYGIGSYLGDWVKTLKALRASDARVIIPGHGAIQRDWAYLDLVVELLESTLAQTRDAVARGLDLEATRKAVDLSGFRQRFTGGDQARIRAFDAYFVGPAVERAWHEARGTLAPPTS